MQYLILGFVALAAGLVLLHLFANANTARLAALLRGGAGIIALAAAALLLARGAAAFAFPLGAIGLWLLLKAAGGSSAPDSWQTDPERISRVKTDHLEMELNLDSGDMRGRVLKGIFEGRELARMAPAEIALMWQDCRFADPPSAQLLEAYLDRIHPTWREDMARAEQEPGAGGRMTIEEAYDILGLKPGATRDQIRRAHRDLMLKMHPDRGGSSYLAAKINEAKDILIQTLD